MRFELKGKIYLNVNEDNIETIRELCEIDDIEMDDGLSQIGYKMCLGDWELYLKYQNGTSDCFYIIFIYIQVYFSLKFKSHVDDTTY